MSDAKFVHLRAHSEFSLFDGLVRVKELVKQAAAEKMPAVALTDQTNLYALVKFYKAALGAGVKPICGVDFWVVDDEDQAAEPFQLTLIVQNGQGYRNLMELVSQAYAEGQAIDPERALIFKSWLAPKAAGLIALSGGRKGDIGRALLAGSEDISERLAFWQTLFPNAFYLELSRTGRPDEERLIHASVENALTTG